MYLALLPKLKIYFCKKKQLKKQNICWVNIFLQLIWSASITKSSLGSLVASFNFDTLLDLLPLKIKCFNSSMPFLVLYIFLASLFLNHLLNVVLHIIVILDFFFPLFLFFIILFWIFFFWMTLLIPFYLLFISSNTFPFFFPWLFISFGF